MIPTMRTAGRTVIWVFSIIFLFLLPACRPSSKAPVRPPSSAGQLYPADRDQLYSTIAKYLVQATVAERSAPRAIIVPHGDYQSAGATSACAYKSLLNRFETIRRVVLIAPVISNPIRGVVVNAQSYRTPLGIYRLDDEAVARLRQADLPFVQDPKIENKEFADELQIPFLQEVLPDARLVSILVGDLTDEQVDRTARAIAGILDDTTVLIAVTDLTHYGPIFNYRPSFAKGPREGVAQLDQQAVDFIIGGDLPGLLQYVRTTGNRLTGIHAIRVLLKIFEVQGWPAKGRLLCHGISWDTKEQDRNAIGFASIGLGSWDMEPLREPPTFLDPSEERTLLELARSVLDASVRQGTGDIPDSELQRYPLTANLKSNYGVAVSLRMRGRLRGGISYAVSDGPLYRMLATCVQRSAYEDTRFQKVEVKDLKDIRIEIAVLSPLELVSDLEKIVIGQDGLMLVNGKNSGVFMPQTPLEWNWDRKTTLEKLSRHAKLESDAYRSKKTQIYRFTAQVFSEKP